MKDHNKVNAELIEKISNLQRRFQEMEHAEAERTRAEKALRASEAFLETIIEYSPISMWVSDEKGTLIRMNQACRDLFQVTDEDLVGKYNVLSDNIVEQQGAMPLVKQVFEKGERVRFILRYDSAQLRSIRLGKNVQVILEVTISPVLDSQGHVVHAIIQHLDITERTRAEEELRESEERYRKLFQYHSAVKLIVDPVSGIIIDANEAAVNYYGWPHERLKGMKIHEINILSPEDIKKEMEAARAGIKTDFVFRHRRADGSIRDVEVFSSKIEVKGKQFLHSVIHDITDRKEAEAELRKSEERFRALSENAPDIIFTLNLTGAITYVNPAWKRILGYGEEEVTGRYFTDFAKEEDKRTYRSIFKDIRDEGKSVNNLIGVMLTKDGKERLFNMNSATIRDLEGRITAVVSTMKDITELKEMERQLSHAQKMESIGTLAGGIAHAFNNLLMGIQGYTSLMLLTHDPSHPNYERLKRIEEQVQNGADLTRQLLGFAQGGRYEVKPTDMNEILAQTSSMFGRTKKEISIHGKYGKDLWSVDVDRGQMEQVFMNLYVNAWQAMPGGGEIYLETAKIILDAEQAFSFGITSGRYIKITMTDTGAGMDEKTRIRIFDPFFTTKGMGRGTGLGLATVYGIIKGHGGTINVESKPGHGTAFTIYLPASDKEVAREMTATGTIAGGTETILLVDDENMVLEVSKEMLETMGYRVHAAGSGQEAIAICMEKRNEIDLVILDMIMPGISGGETFDRLREINPEIRILLSSGYSITGQAQEILDRGCNGFIQKPFHHEKLAGKVREILNGNISFDRNE